MVGERKWLLEAVRVPGGPKTSEWRGRRRTRPRAARPPRGARRPTRRVAASVGRRRIGGLGPVELSTWDEIHERVDRDDGLPLGREVRTHYSPPYRRWYGGALGGGRDSAGGISSVVAIYHRCYLTRRRIIPPAVRSWSSSSRHRAAASSGYDGSLGTDGATTPGGGRNSTERGRTRAESTVLPPAGWAARRAHLCGAARCSGRSGC